MLKIRLQRIGSKKNPFYKIVVIENLTKRDGKYILKLGYYNPLKKKLKLDIVTLFEYIKLGAYPTDTVRHLLYKML